MIDSPVLGCDNYSRKFYGRKAKVRDSGTACPCLNSLRDSAFSSVVLSG